MSYAQYSFWVHVNISWLIFTNKLNCWANLVTAQISREERWVWTLFAMTIPLWPMALWHLQCIKLRCLPSSWGVHLTSHLSKRKGWALKWKSFNRIQKSYCWPQKLPVTWINEGLVMISFCIKLYPSNHNRSRYTTLSLNQPVHHVVQPAPIRKPSASLSWSFRWEILVVLPPNLV